MTPMRRLVIICCDEMPDSTGERIAHCLTVHRDELPTELVDSIEVMFRSFGEECWGVLTDLGLAE